MDLLKLQGIDRFSPDGLRPGIFFYANGSSFSAVDLQLDKSRLRVACDVNNRVLKSNCIHSIFVEKKKENTLGA